MNKKRNVIIGSIAGLVILAAIVLGYFVLSDLKQEKIVKEEATKISKLDLSKEDVDMEIKSKGSYASVEKTMKDFFHEYYEETSNILTIVGDKKITTILSYQNYQTDGPAFTNSLAYLKDTKSKLSDSFTKLTNLTNKKEILKRIETKNLSSRYNDLYEEIMTSGVKDTDIEEAQKTLKNAKETMEQLIDLETELLTFLKDNSASWYLENNRIMFRSQALLTQYNSYQTKLRVLQLKTY